MNEYQKWLQERAIEAQALHGLQAPAPPRSSIEGDVAVPILQALAISITTSLSLAGATLLFAPPVFDIHGIALWTWVFRIAGGAFFLSLAGYTTAFILAHRRQVTEPLDLLWERLILATAPEPRPEPEPRWIIQGRRPQLAANLDHTIHTVEPAVAPEIKELYQFITKLWPTGDITQANCRKHGYTRRYWDKYIGGKRNSSGVESARGLLDRSGIVRKDGHKWVIAVPLNQALAINNELLAHAEAKAAMITLGQSRQKGQVHPDPLSDTTEPSRGGG